jgi:hypothetical protein
VWESGSIELMAFVTWAAVAAIWEAEPSQRGREGEGDLLDKPLEDDDTALKLWRHWWMEWAIVTSSWWDSMRDDACKAKRVPLHFEGNSSERAGGSGVLVIAIAASLLARMFAAHGR